MTRAPKSKAGTPPAPTIPAIPPADVLGRLAALKTTATSDLKQQWRELFAAEPPPYNRRFLESRLAYRIQELAYGGLKPETVQRLEALGEQLDGGNPVLRRIRVCIAPGFLDTGLHYAARLKVVSRRATRASLGLR